MTAAVTTRNRPFICDVPAKMLKRNTSLSKGARMLYGAMRGLANGKTGELAIRGNPLDWKYIAREAEIGRDQWQRLLRELLASGYVTRVRERVELYKGCRKRNVLGRARYFVHKEPRPHKKPGVLLMPDFPTVEKSGTQISSESPNLPGRSASLVSEERKAVGRKLTQSSSGSPVASDDGFPAGSSESKAKTFLPEETNILMERIRRRLRERNPDLFEPYEKHLQNDDFLSSAIELIGGRGEEQIINSIAYFTAAVVEILVAADGPDSETFKNDFGWLVERAQNKRDLRKRYMGNLQPLTAEQEQARQEFNHTVEGKVP